MIKVFTSRGACMLGNTPMDFTHFMRIERVVDGEVRHYVVHMRDPRFSIELLPDAEAPDKMGAGVIKRICVPNSCIGNYQQYAKFIASAQAFFRESLGGGALDMRSRLPE